MVAVCIKVLDTIREMAGNQAEDANVVEKKIFEFCKEAKGKDHRFVSFSIVSMCV